MHEHFLWTCMAIKINFKGTPEAGIKESSIIYYFHQSGNGIGQKGKRHNEKKKHKGNGHNQVFAKPEMDINRKRQKGIWQTGKGHKGKETERKGA
jgi:hypothetical protein